LAWYLDVLPYKPNVKALKDKANQILTLNDIQNIIQEYIEEN
jgi:hypothetical protein